MFIEYRLDDAATLAPLSQRNVDTGVGLERLTCVLQGVESVYDTSYGRSLMPYGSSRASAINAPSGFSPTMRARL